MRATVVKVAASRPSPTVIVAGDHQRRPVRLAVVVAGRLAGGVRLEHVQRLAFGVDEDRAEVRFRDRDGHGATGCGGRGRFTRGRFAGRRFAGGRFAGGRFADRRLGLRCGRGGGSSAARTGGDEDREQGSEDEGARDGVHARRSPCGQVDPPASSAASGGGAPRHTPVRTRPPPRFPCGECHVLARSARCSTSRSASGRTMWHATSAMNATLIVTSAANATVETTVTTTTTTVSANIRNGAASTT